MNHADIFCKTLDRLDRAEAVRALHQALMQFNALATGTENVDNKPIVAEITRLLKVAGHLGLVDTPNPASQVRAFDLGPDATPDRYTVVFVDRPVRPGVYPCLGLSGSSECVLGPHLGTPVNWDELPEALRRTVERALKSQS